MKTCLRTLLVGAALVGGGALVSAQFSVPEIQFDSAPEPLKFPDNIYMGEAAGVATNSKGDVFVYTRTGNPTITLGTARAVSHGGSRLFQFDRSGKFVREIGQGAYGLLQAQQVRVDRQDNIWIVDQMSTQVIKFDANGRVQMVLSRKPEAMRVPSLPLGTPATGLPVVQAPPAPAAGRGAAPAAPAAGRGAAPAGGGGEEGGGGGGRGLPGAGAEGESFDRPTDVAWDSAGNIYVADGYGNARIAKYEPGGKYIKSWGSRGRGPGQFNIVHGIAIDAQGNVYGDLHYAGTAPVSVHRAHGRSRWHGRRGHLQGGSRWETGRQVRPGRQAAEGIRHRELHRLPQRKRAAGWRAE
jgi:NHL repeat-containing protein